MDFLKTHLHPKENSAFFNPANIFLILGLFFAGFSVQHLDLLWGWF